MENQNRERGIIYVGDPMCSWCWGFSPVVDSIIEHFALKLPVFTVLGGLRAGNSEIMDDRLRGFLRHHWEQVNKYTGQPFSFGFLERESFIYDTGPSCRATVAMRLMRPEFTFQFFKSIQQAFYAENRDPTSPETFADLAESFFKIARGEFLKTYNSDRAKDETLDDFRYARTLGITGFPSVLLKDENGYKLLTSGYQSFENLKPKIESWLKSPKRANR
jgi:putative protein-disulfide isomerase